MSELVSLHQSAFIPGRGISSNILLCHDLIKGIHLDQGPPKMCLKIDLHKAIDNVKWGCILYMLNQAKFDNSWLQWMECCIKSTRFSVFINGIPNGFF